MSTPTYDNIQPLIVSSDASGRTLRFTFACPESGERVDASHTLSHTPTQAEQVKHRVRRSLGMSIRGPLSSAVRSIFGHNNPIGRLLGDVASQAAYVAATPMPGSKPNLSQTQSQEAALAAFNKVRGRFAWSEERDGWVAAKSLAS